ESQPTLMTPGSLAPPSTSPYVATKKRSSDSSASTQSRAGKTLEGKAGVKAKRAATAAHYRGQASFVPLPATLSRPSDKSTGFTGPQAPTSPAETPLVPEEARPYLNIQQRREAKRIKEEHGLADYTYIPRTGLGGKVTGLTDSCGHLFALREEAPEWVLKGGRNGNVLQKVEKLVNDFTSDGKNEGRNLLRGQHLGSKAGVFREMGAPVRIPMYNKYYKSRKEEWDGLLAKPVFQRLHGRMEGVFNGYFRDMSLSYKRLEKALKDDLDLRFLGGPFASLCLNTGDNVATRRHRDALNLLLGLCCIFVNGTFDSRVGGHLVLEEAKVIIELGAGDLCFIPSGMFTHWNIPIGKGGRRNSIAYWTSGNVFLWEELAGKPKSQLSLDELAEWEGRKREVWALLLSHFPLV
ncbi:hypothetical protein P7C70_g9490, partial [Phenoliferia sp. Uapishka_3]